MIAILQKEIQAFFNQTLGYLTLCLFLLINSLLLWVFKDYSNIINSGFADLNSFFHNSAWIFALLIPAITMKSFADEKQNGTIEILKTLPIKASQIVTGKFLAYLLIVFIGLIPTLIYVISVYLLGNPVGNIDLGIVLTSYLGLLFVASVYIAIGLFSSLCTQNNITAFIIAISISSFLYFGFDALGDLNTQAALRISNWGIAHHFSSILRGVIDTADAIYFSTLTLLFLGLTVIFFKHE